MEKENTNFDQSQSFQTIGNLVLCKKRKETIFITRFFLFVPFRDKSTLVMEGETMEEAFRHHREASIRGIENHFNKLQKLLEAERYWKKLVDARNKAGFIEEELPDNKEDDEPQLLGEIMEAVADIADMHINVPNLTLEQRKAMLNVDQKRILNKIKSHILSQKEREDLLENEFSRLLRLDNIKLLRMFIGGVGGTGKLFLIVVIKCLVDDIWHPKSSENMCAIVAPTGNDSWKGFDDSAIFLLLDIGMCNIIKGSSGFRLFFFLRPLRASACGPCPCQLSLVDWHTITEYNDNIKYIIVKTYNLSIHSPQLGYYLLPLLLKQRQSWGRRGSSMREHRCSSRREHRCTSRREHRCTSRREHRCTSRREHWCTSRREHRCSSRREHQCTSRREHRCHSRSEHRLASSSLDWNGECWR
uniref:ATP-dependent DNA helicase n=1 Tax=Amphimedon queenslandica TaxID=400682 RepID=A0A1X7U5T0_AMPQE